MKVGYLFGVYTFILFIHLQKKERKKKRTKLHVRLTPNLIIIECVKIFRKLLSLQLMLYSFK